MPDLTHEQLAAAASRGVLTRELVAMLGRPMTDDEVRIVDMARARRRLEQAQRAKEREKRKADKAAQPEDDKALKTDRIKAQVELLRAKIAQIEKTSIPLAEHNAVLVEIAGIVKEALANWCARIEARGNAKEAAAARAAADRCLNRISDKAEEKAEIATLAETEGEADE